MPAASWPRSPPTRRRLTASTSGRPKSCPFAALRRSPRPSRCIESHATPDEVEAFKRFCLDVGEHAAEATKSGDFLGIGGKRISEKESAALDQIASTLGIERSTESLAPADDAEG